MLARKTPRPILKVNLEAHLFRQAKAYLSSRNRRLFSKTKIKPEGSPCGSLSQIQTLAREHRKTPHPSFEGRGFEIHRLASARSHFGSFREGAVERTWDWGRKRMNSLGSICVHIRRLLPPLRGPPPSRREAYLSSRNRGLFSKTKVMPEGSGRFAKANSDNRFANCPFLGAFRKFRLWQGREKCRVQSAECRVKSLSVSRLPKPWLADGSIEGQFA